MKTTEPLTDWPALRSALEKRGARFLSHSHFAISRTLAVELCRGVERPLPEYGREVRVRFCGWLCWMRNPETRDEREAGPFVVWGFKPETVSA
jgi:hypothetical protein